MISPPAIELRFLVPPASRAGVVVELTRGSVAVERMSTVTIKLDTVDRRLAQAGINWCLRRQARRWTQVLKVDRSKPFESEVVRPDANPDASAHAGTPVGDRLIGLLRQAHADGFEPGERSREELRRTTRRIHTTGAIVKVTLDEGRLMPPGASRRVRQIEFELVSGSLASMLGLAERWRKRFALVYDPRSKPEPGWLVEGKGLAPPRKAGRVSYAKGATATEAFGATLDECLAQITGNAIGLIDGDLAGRADLVHQLRVGVRRLRSALRSFQGWVPTPPPELIEELQSLFTTLGRYRDADVLGSGVLSELAKVGAPPFVAPPGPAGPDPVKAVQAAQVQRAFLGWITWRAALATDHGEAQSLERAWLDGDRSQPVETTFATGADDPRTFRDLVERRLGRWHARIAADWKCFDELDDAALHALRKRIKRQRYAVEFFRPLLHQRRVDRYVNVLATIQDRMGILNDLFVARAHYQALGTPDPGAWFALGWLAARIAEVRSLAKPELARLAKADPPAH